MINKKDLWEKTYSKIQKCIIKLLFLIKYGDIDTKIKLNSSSKKQKTLWEAKILYIVRMALKSIGKGWSR